MKPFTAVCQEIVDGVLFDSFGARHYILLPDHHVFVNSNLGPFAYYARFFRDSLVSPYNFIAEAHDNNEINLSITRSNFIFRIRFSILFEDGYPTLLMTDSVFAPWGREVVVGVKKSDDIVRYVAAVFKQNLE